jgi:hypothetical protein
MHEQKTKVAIGTLYRGNKASASGLDPEAVHAAAEIICESFVASTFVTSSSGSSPEALGLFRL